jgi:hypothetical protein
VWVSRGAPHRMLPQNKVLMGYYSGENNYYVKYFFKQ